MSTALQHNADIRIVTKLLLLGGVDSIPSHWHHSWQPVERQLFEAKPGAAWRLALLTITTFAAKADQARSGLELAGKA